MFTGYLSFSDAAKFALIAKSLVLGNGFSTSFSFWGGNLFATTGISTLVPYLVSYFMRLFGVNDFAVISFSFFFYLLLVISVFLLGRRLFGNLAGILAAVAIASNMSFINYALSGASEPLFAFEVVLGSYLLVLRRRWATMLAFLVMVAMYFTRPTAFIFIAGLTLFWLLLHFGYKKGLIFFTGLALAAYFFDKLVIYPLSSRLHITSIFIRGLQAILTYSSNTAVSDSLRGAPSSTLGTSEIIKKLFYNLYNFYKALPEIASPYLWSLFAIDLFLWGKNKIIGSFKLSVVVVSVMTFVVTALTIPFYRYIHPIIPFVYILAVEALIWISQKMFTEKRFGVIFASILVFVFCIGQALGVLILDSRFENNTHNVGKPPVYVVLSRALKDNTRSSQIIITNLDTWASWYGERKTVWFPLEPKMLIDSKSGKIPFDAIYLTSYLMDDQNYYMDNNWRLIFDNPSDSRKWTCDGCGEIAKEFTLKGIYKVAASDDYERQDAVGVLLVKK